MWPLSLMRGRSGRCSTAFKDHSETTVARTKAYDTHGYNFLQKEARLSSSGWGAWLGSRSIRIGRRAGPRTSGVPRMTDLSHQIEAEIPRLRRYARALTR